MTLDKPPLFRRTGEFMWFVLFLLLLLGVRLLQSYGEYREFVTKPFYYTDGVILTQQTKSKNGRAFEVIKFRTTQGSEFYTTANQKSNLTDYRVRIKLLPDATIGFWSYLGASFIKSEIKSIQAPRLNPQSSISAMIGQQHSDEQMASFYSSIFLATPLSYELRDQINALGLSHLVSLSGFHLGILWGVLFWLLRLVYLPLQQRYFPYRYAMVDLGIVAILALGLYVWSVGAPPPLIRSYAMLIIGWIALISGIEIVSFTFLGFTVLLLIAFIPSYIVSIGFWLSVAGVYYIFLVLHYGSAQSLTTKIFSIPIGIFVLMLPLVHLFFALVTPLQLLSPILSLLFTPFFPLSIGMHIVGWGSFANGALRWIFELRSTSGEFTTPPWFFSLYLILSLLAMRYRWSFVLSLMAATGFALVLYGRFV